MYNFTQHRPTGLRQASNMLGKLEEAKLLAGGQTLIPTMKLRLASPGNIIDLNAIADELSGIELRGRSIVIGAMTRHVDVADSPVVKEHLPALAYLAGLVGDPAVRHRGTLGGSVANNDPNADYPAASARPSSPPRASMMRTASSRACSRPRSRPTRSSPRSASRWRKRPATRNSGTRPRASR
jgi:CO/xanthine dehydrogenase FAD-binding subunit